MTQGKLKYANDLNEKIYNCKLFSEIFCQYRPEMVIDLRSEDRKCSYRRCSHLPEDLINKIANVVCKYVSDLESEFESL